MGQWRLKNAKWCPFCGVKALERDDYRVAHTNRRGKKQLSEQEVKLQDKTGKGPDFWCRACHVGFRLSQSLRVEQAISILADERRKRPL